MIWSYKANVSSCDAILVSWIALGVARAALPGPLHTRSLATSAGARSASFFRNGPAATHVRVPFAGEVELLWLFSVASMPEQSLFTRYKAWVRRNNVALNLFETGAHLAEAYSREGMAQTSWDLRNLHMYDS